MKFHLVAVIIIFTKVLYSQDTDLLNKIKLEFMNFEYQQLITDADELLKSKPEYDTSTVIEIFRMKAVSHFSLSQDNEAENSFRNILELDTTFSLDSYQNSPKIIQFFNEIKSSYTTNLKKIEEEKHLIKPDTVYITKEVVLPKNYVSEHSKIIRSLILPGWGHLYSGEKAKGWILAVLGGASFLSSVYFTFDTSSKEKLYTNETNIARFESRYNEYNSAYKMRNISFITFAVVWLYSQLDILILNADISSDGNNLNFKFSF